MNSTMQHGRRIDTASPARMVLRGAAKRCASCGGRGLFVGWFLGAYVMNLVIAQGLVILLAVIPTIVLLNSDADANLVPVFLAGVLGAVLAPLVFYPFSKTLWVVIELILRPIYVREPGDA